MSEVPETCPKCGSGRVIDTLSGYAGEWTCGYVILHDGRDIQPYLCHIRALRRQLKEKEQQLAAVTAERERCK